MIKPRTLAEPIDIRRPTIQVPARDNCFSGWGPRTRY